jgi:acyl-CoA synthetase (AMP-forming)/AMP-acid ligase II
MEYDNTTAGVTKRVGSWERRYPTMPIDPQHLVSALREFISTAPDEPFVEFEGQWWTAARFAAIGAGLAGLLDEAEVPPAIAVGVVVRNHVETAAAIVGLVAAGRPVTMIYSYQSPELIAASVEKLALGVVVAEDADWTAELRAAVTNEDRIGIALPASMGQPYRVDENKTLRAGCREHGETLVEVLTSGTTGAPKHIPLRVSALVRGVDMITVAASASADPQIEILFAPLPSIGGILTLLAYPLVGARFSLLERFDADKWTDTIRRNRPRSIGCTPAMVRSVLERNVPAEAFESVEVVYGGAGPIEVETRQKFAETYGVDFCWGYGATEFAGTVAAWTPRLKAELGGDRPNSVGRPVPGVQVRITDPETGAELSTDQVGRLEVLIPSVSPEWSVTNDQAKLDSDGVLYIFGRLDGAINRGGFKVLPELVAETLRRHPAVKDAGVIGIADSRLGEIPVAAVELLPGNEAVDGEELRKFARSHLPSPSVPAAVVVVETLPRNMTLKIDLVALRRICEAHVAQQAGASRDVPLPDRPAGNGDPGGSRPAAAFAVSPD